MAYAEDRLPSADPPKRRRRPPKATRTPTERGQAVDEPRTSRARPQRPSEPVSTVNATLGGEGQRKAERAARKARKRLRREKERRRTAAIVRRNQQILSGDKTPQQLARERRKRKIARGNIEPESSGLFDILTDKAEDISRHGVVGEFDREAASTGRSLLTGSKNPSPGQLALAAAPVPGGAATKLVQRAITGARAIRTGERAVKATQAAEKVSQATKGARAGQRVKKAKTAAKTEKAKTGAVSAKTQRKVRDREIIAGTRAGKASKRGRAAERASKAGTATKVRYGKAARKARRQKRLHNVANSPVPVIAAAASASPGEVGDRTRAFVEGTVTADPLKSAETTAKAIPGIFAFGATTAGAAFQAAKHGDPGYLKGPVKEAGKAFEALEPLVSGDPDKVRKATEEDVGYVLAPLAPRGAISRPARATGKAISTSAKATGRGVSKPIKKALPKREPQAAPTRLKRAKQIVTGGKQRKAVALEASRSIDPRHHHAVREAEDIVVTGRHAKGSRGLKNPTGPEAVQAAGVLARYGVGRKTKKAGTTVERIKDIRRSFAEGPMTKGEAEATNVRNTMDFLERNPEVLDDPRFWDTYDEFRAKTEPLETSDIAKFGAQARVAEATRIRKAKKRPGGSEPDQSAALRGVKDDAVQDAIASGRFRWVEAKRREDGRVTYHVQPAVLPPGVRVDKTRGGRRAYVDGEITDANGKLIEGAGGWTAEAPKGFKAKGYLYRGLSDEEMASIRKTGKVQSQGRYNVGGKSQRETTSFSIDADQAMHYAAGFAPWQRRPTFDRPSYVIRVPENKVRIRDNPSLPERERDILGPVPAEAIDRVIEVRPYRMTEGELDIVNGGAGSRALGSGSHAYRPTTLNRAIDASEGKILKPWERVTPKARLMSGQKSRVGAWKARDNQVKAAKKAAAETRRARAKVAEAKRAVKGLKGPARERALARVEELKGIEGQARREFQRISTNARALHKELDPFTRPGVDPSVHVKRPPESRQMVEEFVEETRAARPDDLDDPIWLSEPDPGFRVEGGHGGPSMPSTGARAQHRWTGRAEAMDTPDRSLEGLLQNTLIRPHTQRGIHKFINRVNRMGLEVRVKGRRRRVVTDREWNQLVARGDVDPTEYVPVPSRHWNQAMKGEPFDLTGEVHSAVNARLAQDLRKLEDEPGVKNVILPREVAEELAAQLNPKRSGLEAVTQSIGMAGARVVLFSPAWVAAQFVNEGSQAVAAVGARGFAGGAVDLYKLWRSDRQAYRDLIHASGPVSPSATPVPHKLTLTTDEYRRFANTVRIVRKTTVGRFLHDAATLRTFGNIDRWKGTRIRSIAVLAQSNRQFGTFTRGLGKSLVEMERLSDKLGKMSRAERQNYVAKNINTKEFEPMLDYLDDVMGNWRAFTRLERQAGPLIAFYPYVRMSLRWTFWTFPKNHPIKAEILYFLSQQNRDELSKLMGREPDFLESMLPVWLDQQGEPNAVMPGGRRFGAPGMNTMVEALGEGNISRLPNTLNPVITALYRGFSGTDPFTGEQVINPKDAGEVAMHLGNMFLSMGLPARVTGANRLGKEESDLKEVYDNLDPNRAMRSAANPFIPQSAERFRMQTILSDALDDVSDKPEYGDLVDALMSGDRAQVKELAKKVDLAKRAQKIIEEFMPPTKKAKKAVSDAGSIYYEGTKGLQGTSGGGGSAANALQNEGNGGRNPRSAAEALSGTTTPSSPRKPRSAADALAQLP